MRVFYTIWIKLVFLETHKGFSLFEMTKCDFVDLFWFIYSDCPLSICFLASVCSDSPNPSAFSASISTLSKAVQMAFSQRLTAVVLRSVTNELFYCLFPSLCTDGRILSTSFYCCWMDSWMLRFIFFFFRGFIVIFSFSLCVQIIIFFNVSGKERFWMKSHLRCDSSSIRC